MKTLLLITLLLLNATLSLQASDVGESLEGTDPCKKNIVESNPPDLGGNETNSTDTPADVNEGTNQ